MPQHPIARRIAYPWIGYVYRSLLALVVAVALAATPSAASASPPAAHGDQSWHNGDHGVDPFVNWNS